MSLWQKPEATVERRITEYAYQIHICVPQPLYAGAHDCTSDAPSLPGWRNSKRPE